MNQKSIFGQNRAFNIHRREHHDKRKIRNTDKKKKRNPSMAQTIIFYIRNKANIDILFNVWAMYKDHVW